MFWNLKLGNCTLAKAEKLSSVCGEDGDEII